MRLSLPLSVAGLLCGSIAPLSVAAPLPSASPLGEELVLVYADEFDGAALDMEAWASAQYASGVDGGVARGPDNAEVRDGKLLLHVHKEKRPSGKGFSDWTAGYVYLREPIENNTFVEARFKPGQASGVNNAFWLTATEGDRDGDSNRYEIDIVETRQDVGASTPTGRAHLAWHDWKTQGYTTHPNGKADHVAQGIHHPHPFDAYQTWGLWYGETEMIFFLDGQEVWRGQTHSRYTDQWHTGVGKFKHWFPNQEQRAYGRFGQPDWSYLGGYTGDRLNVVFSNKPWAATWSPLTDAAHGTFMSVDHVRIFRPKRLLDTKPETRALVGDALVLGPGEERLVPWAAAQALSVDGRFPRYFSFSARAAAGADLEATLEDAAGTPLLTTGSAGGTDLRLGFADLVRADSAFPAKERRQPLIAVNETATWVLRVTPPPSWTKLWAASVGVFPEGGLPAREPYFYPNIDARGNTSVNNHWHLNAKGIPPGEAAHAIRFRNRGTGRIEIRDLRSGANFSSLRSSL
jgi:hypothetical protein